MMLRLTSAVIGLSALLWPAQALELVSFDGKHGNASFYEMEDPVMGSQSWGNWTVNFAGGLGTLAGIVTIVDRPAVSLVGASPGFVKAAADGHFADASAYAQGELVLLVRSSTPTYPGFHVSFAAAARFPGYACEGGGHIPFSRGCYKAKFSVPAGTEFTSVRIPLSNFSDRWKPATGEATTSCTHDKSVCPSADALKKIQRIEIWAEGFDGEVHLDVKSISMESSALVI